MATITRMFGRRRRGDHEDRALEAQSTPPSLPLYQATPGGTTVTPSSALAIGDAFACIRALADSAASLPLIAYRRTTSGRTRLEGPTADLLRAPAPATTQASLVGQMVAHLNLYGSAYVGKFRGADGRVDQLAMLAPDRVTPRLERGQPRYSLQGPHGEVSDHGVEDIIHIRALSTDGLIGLSPVQQCRVALGLSQQLAEHAATFMANGARPGGILKLQRFGDSDAQVEALRTAWETNHRGVMNAHKIAVVAGEVDFMPLSMPLEDAQFLAQRQLSAVEVARIFRVPPWMIGATTGDSMTYSNTEQQALQFVTFSLRPQLVQIEQALSADPDLFAARTYCEFLLDALLRADSATRAQVYTAALDPLTGWMNRSEVRRLENLDGE